MQRNAGFMLTFTVTVLAIDTAFAYSNRAKITTSGTVEPESQGVAPTPREIACPGGVLSGLIEMSEGVVPVRPFPSSMWSVHELTLVVDAPSA